MEKPQIVKFSIVIEKKIPTSHLANESYTSLTGSVLIAFSLYKQLLFSLLLFRTTTSQGTFQQLKSAKQFKMSVPYFQIQICGPKIISNDISNVFLSWSSIFREIVFNTYSRYGIHGEQVQQIAINNICNIKSYSLSTQYEKNANYHLPLTNAWLVSS